MKKIFDGFIMSLTMFSIIPAPHIWNNDAFTWVIPAFPFVGLIIGCLWYGFAYLLTGFGAPLPLSAAIIFLFPLFISGFIHTDGYMDTCDAIFSRAELAKKRAILKDPHVGAFAVIFLGVYLLIGFSSVYSMLESRTSAAAFVFIPVVSRCLAGIALLKVKPISENGFGATFRANTKPVHTILLSCFLILCFAVGFTAGGKTILITLTGVLLGGVLSAVYAVRQLDGISGDLCGFIIMTGELCALLVLGLM